VAVTELTGWRLATAGRRAPGDYDRERVRLALDPDGRACGLVYLRAAVPASTGAETEAVADETTAPDRTGLITAIGVGPDADRRGVLEALITDALRTFACLGEHYAEVTVTAGDREFAALLRSMRFRHDQTDVCYELS
jgi:ribosomal protein S18 acetylase RimI-like enzyme